jgi:hypothetical protein
MPYRINIDFAAEGELEEVLTSLLEDYLLTILRIKKSDSPTGWVIETKTELL